MTTMFPLEDDENRDGIALSGATQTIPEYIKGEAPSITVLRARFDEARSDPQGARTKAQTARDYYDGPKQLSSTIRSVLESRGQPRNYTNRIRPAINGILGVLEAGRRDPRCLPRNPDDEDSADVATKTLRFINDKSRFNDTQMDVAENFFIEGAGAAIIEMDGEDVAVTQIRWEEFYYDPYARRSDLKDARYMGIAKWMDASALNSRYRAQLAEIGDVMAPHGMSSDAFEDRGGNACWVDAKRRRVMLIEEYAMDGGEWKRIVYVAAGVLEYDTSPYLDDKGRPCCPIEGTRCYVNRDNDSYGAVDDMIPIQDEVNASRSRSLHLMNSRQVQQTDPMAPPIDAEIARIEAAKADGVIPPGWGIVPTSEMTQANMVRMQEAKSEIERMAPTPLARDLESGSAVSGRARQVSQQAGLSELARPLGRLHGWVLRCYEQMWNRARQYWTDPMWVRVTDNLKAPEFLKVNEPVMGPTMLPVADPQTGQPMVDPMTGQPQMMQGIGPVDVKNRLADMDMDIILDQDDDTASLQQEVFAELMQLLAPSGGLPAIFSPEFEVALEISPMSDKRRIMETIKTKREERDQSQVVQMQQQLAQLQAQLEAKQELTAAETGASIELKAAQTAATYATANKTMVETAGKEVELTARDPFAEPEDQGGE